MGSIVIGFVFGFLSGWQNKPSSNISLNKNISRALVSDFPEPRNTSLVLNKGDQTAKQESIRIYIISNIDVVRTSIAKAISACVL